MANEGTFRASILIEQGNLKYRAAWDFRFDVASGATGPSPGAISATLDGTDISLSALAAGGVCIIRNLDSTNFVEVGVWDGVSFYPLMDILAGESWPLRLAADLAEEFGTGTGTTGQAVNTLRIKADTAACDVVVEAFDK